MSEAILSLEWQEVLPSLLHHTGAHTHTNQKLSLCKKLSLTTFFWILSNFEQKGKRHHLGSHTHSDAKHTVDPCTTFDPSSVLQLWSWVLPTKFGSHRAFLSLYDPWLTPHDLWPQQCFTLLSGVLSSKLGGHKTFLKQLDPSEPYMTFYSRLVGAGSGVLVTKFGWNR